MLSFTISAKEDIKVSELKLALINYIVSKQNDVNFVIRVEDSSKETSKMQDNIDILKKFAIDTTNVTSTTQNTNIYKTLATNLVKKASAYLCFCDNEGSCSCKYLDKAQVQELLRKKESYSIKVNNSKEEISFKDAIYKEIKSFVDSFTIIDRSENVNKIFALAVDNMSLGTTIIVDSAKNLDTRVKEIYLQKLLGYNQEREFYHIPDIKYDVTVKELIQKGFLPDTIINYLLDLEGKKEIFYLPDTLEWFNLDSLSNKEYSLDIDKLKKLNQQHLKSMDSKKLSKIFGFADSDIGNLLKLYLDSAYSISELDSIIVSIFSPKDCSNEKVKEVAEIIKKAPMLSSFQDFKEYILKRINITEDELSKTLSLLILGFEDSSKLEEAYRYINPYLLEVVKCR